MILMILMILYLLNIDAVEFITCVIWNYYDIFKVILWK